ncbi:MAG: phycobilisome protein [Cyanobacteria bacterium J06626_23]
MASSLTPRVKELIEKSRIVSFATWQDRYDSSLIGRLQQADDHRQYLSDDDLTALALAQPEGNQPTGPLAAARQLREQAAALVDQARAEVLAAFPGITEPGGALFPAIRAEACWRDFWQFLRCVSYGVAAQRTDYTDPTGLHYMEQLYQELQVPLPAMVRGLESLKTASSQQVGQDLAPYFDSLINALASFQPEPTP